MEVRMDLEGHWCFGTGATCRGNFHFLVILVLGDILVNIKFPWERECTAYLHLWLESEVLKSPISLPSISGKLREEWYYVIKGFLLDLLAASSVLCHIMLCYLFPPFSLFFSCNSYVTGTIPYILFGCSSQSMWQLMGTTCSAEGACGKLQVVMFMLWIFVWELMWWQEGDFLLDTETNYVRYK